MSLLTLKDVGKIYVSDGNVAVGIRGVNLSFDRGEFVAVTGKSGSGKSTLLNVISGMDSYEEGELLIEGQTTSHYLQKEWEEYREKYISFIFQDYNIIESFTVLQNVELSLMHIEDKKERRRRALELLDRVGMTSHIKHKGSKLSGGQKQRTVIARALAKDSPIILADEPTGNLDSATSAEIIELLREVSKDKLLIVVTHNFEQVEKCATRHIRIFDGAVESDHVISHPEVSEVEEEKVPSKRKKKRRSHDFRNGVTLGRAIFTSKPRLSFFFCLLMIVGTLGIFMVTTMCGEAAVIFEDHYMFEHIEGRVVLTKQNGEVLTADEIKKLAKDYDAESYLRYDLLLDREYGNSAVVPDGGDYEYIDLICTYGEDFGDDIIGNYPEKENEVFLYLPISYQSLFGKDSISNDKIFMNRTELEVTGIKYYYDNNLPAKCLFTNEGFSTATALYYLASESRLNITARVSYGSKILEVNLYDFFTSYDMESGKIYVDSAECRGGSVTDVTISATYYNYNYHMEDGSAGKSSSFSKAFGTEYVTDKNPNINTYDYYYDSAIIAHPSVLREIAEGLLSASYRQVSLFYENDEIAHEAAEKLNEAGYIAVTSDTTYTPDAATVIINLIAGVMMAFFWVISIVFLAFFIGLCSNRTLGAFKSDMAIMRSMGIPVKVIKVGMYVRMLIALVPAYIFVIGVAYLIFTTPQLNAFFLYLYPWQYALIFVGMLILTFRITHNQIKKLFKESVKKSLKGGAAE